MKERPDMLMLPFRSDDMQDSTVKIVTVYKRKEKMCQVLEYTKQQQHMLFDIEFTVLTLAACHDQSCVQGI